MFNLPIYQAEINDITGHFHPNSVHYNSRTYWYFWRSLYQRAISTIDFTIPERWNMDYFQYCVWILGFTIVLDYKRYGLLPQHGTLREIGVQYQPTIAMVNTKFINEPDLRIGTDCELIRLSNDYIGIGEIIDRYAKKFSLLESAYNVSLINTKIPYIVAAKNKSWGETFKSVMDKVNQGDPIVVYEKAPKQQSVTEEDDPWSFLDLHVGENFISDKLAEQYREIMNQYDSEVGIPNLLQTGKKERLVSNEIETNNAETVSRLTVFFNTLTRSIKQTIKLYPELEGQLSCAIHNYDTPNTGRKEVVDGDS